MASISWKNNASGNWDTPSNWSTGILPGANDDVTISTSSAQTITHSASTDSIHSLFVGNDTIAISGGSLTVLGNTTLNSALTESGGLFRLSGASARIAGTVAQTAGTINVASGMLTLDGTGNNFAGTLSGAAVDFAAGTDLLAAGMTLNMGRVLIGNAAVTLGKNITQSGLWTQTSGTLALGGHKLTAAGTMSLDGGVINGTGTVAITNAAEISGAILEGSVVLNNTGNITQTGNFDVGFNSADTPQLNNKAGATYTIANHASISGTSGATVTNAGTLDKLASGNSQIGVSTTSTGHINITSGTLSFAGTTNSFSGRIAGAGTLGLVLGADTFGPKLSLTVAHVQLSGGAVTLGANLAYAHDWIQTGGTLALGGMTLTTTGNDDLDGGVINGSGTLAIGGAADLSGMFLEGSAVISNTGSIVQTNNWFLGFNGPDSAKLENQAGATFNITNNSDIDGSAGASLVNAGTLEKSLGAGTSLVEVATINSGVVDVGSGTMQFLGTISGTGTFNVGAGTTLQFEAAVNAGSTVDLGTNSDLFMKSSAAFAAEISGFAAGNLIELTGLGFNNTSLSFNASTDQLTVSNGSFNKTLQFVGSYTGTDFRLLSDNGVAAIAHS